MAGVSWWIVLFFKDVRSCLCRVCLYTWQSCLRLALPARIQDPGIIYPDLLRSANISISSLCWTLTDALFKPLWLLLQISVVELNNGVCKEKKKGRRVKRVEETRGEAVRTRASLWKLLPLTVSVHTVVPVPKKKASHADNGGDVESNGWPGQWRQGMC